MTAIRNALLTLCCLLLCSMPHSSRANMAQPYFEGAHNAVMYGNEKYSVVREVIDIDIRKDSLEHHLYSVFKVHYKIQSQQRVDLPLLFLALYRSDTHAIKVNGRTITSQQLSKHNIKEFPFIYKSNLPGEEAYYRAAYGKDEAIHVRLEDLIYFNAPLHSGENDVYIEYASDFGFDTYGFLKNYSLHYSLYPSKFWKSFGPIQVNLHLNGLAELTESNLGKATFNGDVAQWTIHTFDQDVDITINHKTSLLGKILLFLHPFGIALLLLIGMVYVQCRLLKTYPNAAKWIFWLGIFIVPALFYTLFFLAFDWIEWVLGTPAKHGYVFLWVFTYPIFVALYGLLLSLLKRAMLPKPIKKMHVL